MKIRSLMAATLVFSGGLAFAQMCPPITSGSACLVPARGQASQVTMYTMPSSMATTTMTVPCPTGVVSMQPMTTYVQPMTSLQPMTPIQVVGIIPVSSTSMVAGMQQQYGSACAYPSGISSGISPDATAISNQIAGLRNDVRSLQGQVQVAAIQMRGQALIDRMNMLMAEEMTFRQQLAANPNLPGAQERAILLSLQAQNINRDLVAFNTELNMIPVAQRPFLAAQLNSFNVAYWQPATQRFAEYSTQFQQNASTVYQPAFAANPWLQPWVTGYQTTVSSIAVAPQQYASTSWWADTRVLGSMETFSNGTIMGNTMILPQGTIVYIPPSASVGTTGMIMNGTAQY